MQAAENGNGDSHFQLATYYMQGLFGYAKDLYKAKLWLQRAAEQNVGRAYFILGKWRASGVAGPRDLSLAVSLYKRGCDLGDTESLHQIALLMTRGVVEAEVRREIVSAVCWSCFQCECIFGSGCR